MSTDDSSVFYTIDFNEKYPSIGNLRNIYIKANEDDYRVFIDDLISNNRKLEFELFLYYLILFKDIPEIQKMLNSDKLDIEILEHLIMFSYGFISVNYGSPDRILDNLLYFLNEDSLVRLCTESTHISRDLRMVIFILTKLSVEKIDAYFSRTENIADIITAFSKLPESAITEIIYRNTALFDYIISMMPAFLDRETSDSFFMKYAKIIDQMREINRLLKMYDSNTRVCTDREDLSRIAILVSLLQKSDMALGMLADGSVLSSNNDRLLAIEISSNPLFADLIDTIKSSCYFEQSDFELF
ncbi:MAG TPA: hypothetical protein VF857_06360 [Spirochaetota bacterium]